MIETDAFFESDPEVIKTDYLPQEGKRNTSSVGQLLYEFFVFFLYEFDASSEVISIKELNGFARKFQPDKLPFSNSNSKLIKIFFTISDPMNLLHLRFYF